ncbi:hypothetical protein [Niabella beijingensis]|uniref:hypothetical protein n=1 Tax=Niabella beijingensis TaxID=2872700 RepID=UPI001CBEA621|nr:hypothetical protein [Niabella beijingensis]MBZ4192170.1 hypothetical protein [Niabella beijingensis]
MKTKMIILAFAFGMVCTVSGAAATGFNYSSGNRPGHPVPQLKHLLSLRNFLRPATTVTIGVDVINTVATPVDYVLYVEGTDISGFKTATQGQPSYSEGSITATGTGTVVFEIGTGYTPTCASLGNGIGNVYGAIDGNVITFHNVDLSWSRSMQLWLYNDRTCTP